MKLGATSLELIVGDITKLDYDAIVNAANSSLLGGGGVDGAIHRAAGPDLVHECRLLGGCKTGEAKITKGYRLKARNIIHTVGPVWRGGGFGERESLASCYCSSLQIAQKYSLTSVAFPAISTGIYRFPLTEAATTATLAVADYLRAQPNQFLSIAFVCFDTVAASAFEGAMEQLQA